MKSNGNRYSPAFKFRVAPEALKAEGKGAEAQVENGSLFGDAATLEELVWAIGRQMRYHNHGRRHSRLGYRSPMEYLASEGFVPKAVAEIGPKSGSVPGAHIHGSVSGAHIQSQGFRVVRRIGSGFLAKFRNWWTSLSCGALVIETVKG